MKKVLATVAVSTALVMGGAVAASAAGIEMEGGIRVRGLSEQKMVTNIATHNHYDQFVRVGMKSMPSDNLTGYVLLETGATSSGDFGWGAEDVNTLYRGGTQLGGANSKLGIIQAWIDYKPVSTLGLKVGHQTVAPGTKQFVNHENTGDDAIFVNWDPTKSTHAHVAIVKLAENNQNDNSDDLDAYALVATHKFSDAFKMGANLIHVKGGSEDDGASVSIFYPGLALNNLGVDAEYKLGNITLKGDVNLQSGTIQDMGTAASEIDADGYAFQLGVDYKIDNSNVGLLFAQGSGQDPDDAKPLESAFVNFIGDSPYQVYIPGYRKVTPGSFQAGIGQADGANSGLSNLTLYQLNAKTSTTCPLTGKKLSIRGALSYMETTEDVISTTGVRENEIGTELDVVAAWALTSNLTYQIEAAYLWTGDVYKNTGATAGTNAGADPEDAYFLRHGITMKF